ncbi:protein translocase subunit SecF [Arenicella sp. 4NH20-0111]|uniref:protein translocase subunit SecF n=1 Tax=Arenicella sp. 4NH20-0111 TaxID=3127648 RepID=UPI0031034538
MQILAKETKIDFIGLRSIALILSFLLIAAGIYSLTTKGLNYGIDFSGGTKIELVFDQDIAIQDLRDELVKGGYDDAVVQYFGSNQDILIRVPLSEKNSDVNSSSRVVEYLDGSALGTSTLRSVEFVGPTFGKELFEKGILALVYSLIGVMIYVAFRFEWKFSLGSVTALIHDVAITLGIFSLIGLEFTLPVLAALLAVIGYSLNDTIVVFDRIRENFRKLRETDTKEIMNYSINQTLPRTILTSLTTLLVLIALYFYGGDALNGFAATLIIGVLIGTYSSIFVASPTVLALGAKPDDLIQEVVEKEGAEHPDMYMP